MASLKTWRVCVFIGSAMGVGFASGAGACNHGAGGGSTSHGSAGVGGGIQPPPPSCKPAANGGTKSVAMPMLMGSLTDDWHEAWLASPAVADLDGDGTKEIVVSRAGRVIAWHPDGSVLWKVDLDGRTWSSPIVADFRPDIPGLETAQASADKIYMFDAKGQPVPGFPAKFQGELRSLAAGDIDGDGKLELVAVTTQELAANGQNDIIFAVRNDGSWVQGFPANTSGASGCDNACYVYNGYDQNVAIGDVDGDGISDIFATQDDAYNSLHKGTGFAFNAAPIFTKAKKFLGVRGLHNYAEAQQGYANDESTALQAHHTNTAPAIADVNGDGKAELVYLASVQNAAQTDRKKGVALWVMNNDGTRPDTWVEPLQFPNYLSGLEDYGNNIVAITNQVTVADIDPTRPGPEMIFAGFDGYIHAVDSAKNEIWNVQYTTSDVVGTGGILVADLTGDGSPEIVFTTYSTDTGVSNLFILDSGGNLQQKIALPDRGAMPVPTIDDVDGDGQLEIVISLKDSDKTKPAVLIYKVPGSSNNCMLWPTGRRDYLRDGYLPPTK